VKAAVTVELEAKRIVRAYTAFLEGARTTIGRALECGHLLASVKAEKNHGEWIPWLEQQREVFGEQFPSERTAQAHMRLWNRRVELPNPKSVAVLTGVSQALNMLAEPKTEKPKSDLAPDHEAKQRALWAVKQAHRALRRARAVLPDGQLGPAERDTMRVAFGHLQGEFLPLVGIADDTPWALYDLPEFAAGRLRMKLDAEADPYLVQILDIIVERAVSLDGPAVEEVVTELRHLSQRATEYADQLGREVERLKEELADA